MRSLVPLAAAVALLAGPAFAQDHDHSGHGVGPTASQAAEAAWTALPTITRVGRGRSALRVKLDRLTAAEITVHPPGGGQWTAAVNAGRAEVAMAEDGNYHWLVAREETSGQVRVATAAIYFPAPGPAPLGLLEKVKHELEIVPDPLPREHRHYQAREEWPFLVRWNGKPLAGTAVHLETRNGTRQRLVTDGEGRVAVVFPDDFPPGMAQQLDHHARPPSVDFVLWVEREEGGTRYLTAFNDSYRPYGLANVVVWPSAVFLGLGMLAAVPLLRRPKGEGK